ncbi:MAG: corrinoid protein [Chloroflexi bacterium]|nr:corrinoid protein [Chloroflexota bacterium]
MTEEVREKLDAVREAVIHGKTKVVKDLTSACLDAGATPGAILNEALIPGMARVGERFGCGEIFVPEMLIAARAMYASLDVLKPLMNATQMEPRGTVLIGTVKGDLHDIGKNLVRMMVEGAGYTVVDLGADVAPSAFIEAVHKHRPQVLGLSALLTTTMAQMRTTLRALDEAGLRARTKVMVGGAPVTQRYADEIGADGYGADANSAVRMVNQWCSEPQKVSAP